MRLPSFLHFFRLPRRVHPLDIGRGERHMRKRREEDHFAGAHRSGLESTSRPLVPTLQICVCDSQPFVGIGIRIIH